MPDFSLDDVLKLVREFQSWSPPSLTMYVISLLSVVTTVIIARVLSGSRITVFAGSYILLFFCAMVANFLFRMIPMGGTTDMQKAILATISGQIPAVIILFFLFKREELR